MRKHLKSRNPALNIPRRHEAVATDTVYSDTPAVDSGVKQAQFFVGKESLVSDIYPMRSGQQFINIWKIISVDAVPWTSLSVIQPRMKSPKRFRTFSEHTILVTGNRNPIIRTKTKLSGGIEPSRHGPTPL